MEDTVDNVLKHVVDSTIQTMNCVLQKEIANTEAKEDIVIGTETIAKDIPATYLLYLEKELANIKQVIDNIPVLDSAKDWKKDETQKNIYKAKEVESYKTEKVLATHIAVPATKEHPAQAQTYSKDEVIGSWFTKEFSSAITIAEKEKKQEKLNELLRAVKKARMRANEVEVKDVEIGKNLFKYINS